MKKFFWVSYFLFFFKFIFFSQTSIEHSAIAHYQKKEFDKAELFFENLYKQDPVRWFDYLFRTLLALQKTDEAEKLCKHQMKILKNSSLPNVYLAQIQKNKNNKGKYAELSEKAIKLTDGNDFFIRQTAEAFLKFEEFDFAIKTYDFGAKKNPHYPYFYEKADVYKQTGDIRAMINCYLDAVEFRETEMYNVQMHLGNSLGYDEHAGGFKNPILKEELYKRIQQKNTSVVLIDFLIFVLNQQKEFYGAFVQAKALDKRLNENGLRVFNQSKICLENEDYTTARLCFDYLATLPQSPFKEQSDILKGEMMYKILYAKFFPKPEEINEVIRYHEDLKNNYLAYSATYLPDILCRLASLYSDYKNDYGAAIELLEPLLESPNFNAQAKAKIKMKLADILVQSGNLWDASLLYGQVDRDFKNDMIGHEAKFKNAKIYFYAGEFRFAKSQADVLKGSTSKLTANDALELSLIISDGLGFDSISGPLQYFAKACLVEEGRKYTLAVQYLDSIPFLFKENPMPDHVMFKKAVILANSGDIPKAIELLASFTEKYPHSIHADNACLLLAKLYNEKLEDREKSMKVLEHLMDKYPGSVLINSARSYYRNLRGEKNNQP
ncbi:MAG: tetratricopeptide repeat protein [Bacteroidia bacterium]|nr:tetratricopeptide repeat protein [Bacteroidia bacterium]